MLLTVCFFQRCRYYYSHPHFLDAWVNTIRRFLVDNVIHLEPGLLLIQTRKSFESKSPFEPC